MKPSELYAMTPQSIEHELYSLKGCYFNHLPEVGEITGWERCESNRIEVRVVKHFDFDCRRFWRLATVWFDGKPVMVVRNAGREGDDHHSRFVTDTDALRLMVQHIRTLVPTEVIDAVSADADIAGLEEFYGNSLGGHFERSRY